VTPTQGGGTAALTLGSLFAERYQIKSLLGRGGMGVVYLAHDIQLDEPVALKLLRSEVLQQDPTLLQRFKLEIRLARRITHRNVLRTHDFGESGGVPYISMEYVEGVTLKDLVRTRGALPVGVGLRIAKQMCLGLDAAHAEGVIHRDIKPQNMLIIPETGDLKITDFGIARVSEVGNEQVTSTGMVLGTPAYMPPEQAQGKPADFRSDIYSLGVVLFEIFCGRVPFSGDTHVAVLMQQIQSAPPSPRSLNPKLPEALEAVILKCLEKSPARRYARASEVLAALSDLSSHLESEAA
jgi:serine/threonine-protein kinase